MKSYKYFSSSFIAYCLLSILVHAALLIASIWLHQSTHCQQVAPAPDAQQKKQYTLVIDKPMPAQPASAPQPKKATTQPKKEASKQSPTDQQTLTYLGATSPTGTVQLQDIFTKPELTKQLASKDRQNNPMQKKAELNKKSAPTKAQEQTTPHKKEQKLKAPAAPTKSKSTQPSFEILTRLHPQAVHISIAPPESTPTAHLEIKKPASEQKKQSTFGPHVLFKQKKNGLVQEIGDAPPTTALQAAFSDLRSKEQTDALAQQTDPHTQLKIKHLMDTLIHSLQQQIKEDVFARKMPTELAPDHNTYYYLNIEPDSSIVITHVENPTQSRSWNNYIQSLMSRLHCTNQLGRSRQVTFTINPKHLVLAKKTELSWVLQ